MATPLGGRFLLWLRERERAARDIRRGQSREKRKQTGHGQGYLFRAERSRRIAENSKKENSRESWSAGVG